MLQEKILIVASSVVVNFSLIAQQPIATYDPNYQLSPSKSDEFNSLDQTKWLVWDVLPNNDPQMVYNLGGNGEADPNNVSVVNGKLLLVLDPPITNATPIYTPNECCKTGAISSKNEDYGYGYYEVRAKMPGNFHNGLPNGQKIGAAFWLAYFGDDQGNFAQGVPPNHIHDEIDFFETDGQLYKDGKSWEVGVHDELQTTGTPNTHKPVHKTFYGGVNDEILFDDYHTYACEWFPNRITFYFDGEPVFTEWHDTHMISNFNTRAILSLHSQPGSSSRFDEDIVGPPATEFNSSMQFPQNSTLEIDYFRYYELDQTYCGQSIFLSDQSTFDGFVPGVRENIYIGWISPILLASGTPKIMRASNQIIINSNFSTSTGAELLLIPSPCN